MGALLPVHPYVGVELRYVDFGKPHYNLTRGSTGETSVMYAENRSIVAAVRGFYPVNDKFRMIVEEAGFQRGQTVKIVQQGRKATIEAVGQ